NLGGNEAENANAPRLLAELLLRLTQEFLGFGLAQECEREERQGAAGRDGIGEGRRVADASHWSLQDRVLGTVRLGERRPGRQVAGAARGVQVVAGPFADVLHDPGDGDAPSSKAGGTGHVLTQKPES